jgi:hypothetical protein
VIDLRAGLDDLLDDLDEVIASVAVESGEFSVHAWGSRRACGDFTCR